MAAPEHTKVTAAGLKPSPVPLDQMSKEVNMFFSYLTIFSRFLTRYSARRSLRLAVCSGVVVTRKGCEFRMGES